MNKFGRKSPAREAARVLTLQRSQVIAAAAGTDADTLDGHHAIDFLSPQYLVLTADTNLTNERVLVGGNGLSLTDGGAGGNATLNVGISGLGLSVDASNVILASSSDPGAAASILATSGAGLLSLLSLDVDAISDKSGGNLTLAPAGDIILNPTGNEVLPNANYDINLGSISKKYLTLHAAELWVETLVAQDTMATIGGRILVGPTTTLIADLGSGDSTIDVKHNNLASGDRVVMEASGKLEWLAITSGASAITGGYRYSVTRNLDGSGANTWYAGDAVFNTGTTGDGYIDLYSLAGVIPGSTAGPTIVGNIRNSSTYNDIEARWAIGNLNGLFGKSTDTYGAAFGDYADGNYLITEADGLVLVAGGGALQIDQYGITITTPVSAAAAPDKIKFSTGSVVTGEIFSTYGSDTSLLYIKGLAPATGSSDASLVELSAEVDGYTASQLVMRATDGAEEPYILLTTALNGLHIMGDFTRIYGDVRIEDGLYVGDIGTDPATGTITTTDYIVALGGLHVGGTSDPGTDNLMVDGFYRLPVSTELTISGGVITVTKSLHTIDTDGNAATDDLVTINGGTEGDILILRSADAGRDVTLKDNTGNLRLAGDYTLDATGDTITLYYDGAGWIEISRSDNA